MNQPRSRLGCEGSGKRTEKEDREDPQSHGTCRGEGREAGLEQGWAWLGCSGSQLGQRLFIWFLINQRKCLDQIVPLLLDCLPRVGPGLGPGSPTRAGSGQINDSN